MALLIKLPNTRPQPFLGGDSQHPAFRARVGQIDPLRLGLGLEAGGDSR